MRTVISGSSQLAVRACGRVLLAMLVLAAGCGREVAEGPIDGSLLTTSGGDIAPATRSGTGLAHTVTSEDYRRWMTAEGALASIGVDDLSERIPLEAATEEDIDRVVEELSAHERARTAIESSGLDVEDYVRTTVALEQALSASDPDAGVLFRGVPAENIIITDRHHADVERLRAASPLRIVDGKRDRRSRSRDRDDDDDDKKGKRGRGKGKGNRDR